MVRHANKPLFGLLVLIQFQGHVCSIRWPLAIKGAQCHQERNKGNVMRSIENELSGKKKERKKPHKTTKPKMLAVFLHGKQDTHATIRHSRLRASVLIAQTVCCTYSLPQQKQTWHSCFS